MGLRRKMQYWIEHFEENDGNPTRFSVLNGLLFLATLCS